MAPCPERLKTERKTDDKDFAMARVERAPSQARAPQGRAADEHARTRP